MDDGLDLLGLTREMKDWIDENSENYLSRLLIAVEDHTLLDPKRLRSLWKLVHDVRRRGVTGDIVECGSYKGGSSALLRSAMGPGRKLWIYDSFQGLPEPSEKDGAHASGFSGNFQASADDVIEILNETGARIDQYVLIGGWFEESFSQTLPERVALLHCDSDWYESVLLVLETFYPLMPDGACVVLDDFGHWEGCRMAFFEFCENNRERPLIERVGYSQAYWVKGKEHNRGT